MAHSFLKKLLDTETSRFRLEIISCLTGGLFLIDAWLTGWIYDNRDLSEFPGIIAALLLGAPLIWHALCDLWRGEAEMNEFAALSFMASFSIGEYRTAAAIAFFMILAQLIEYRSQIGARKNIESLLRLSPDSATRIEDDGSETQIDSNDLKRGDIIRVRPGDCVPGDGMIIRGESSLNEAAITGEALPKDKGPGDQVFGGTINVSGMVDIEITADAADTTLSRIKELIAGAENSRTPVMRLIDQYAGWYTPVILMLAAIVLFFTRDLNRAISMLIIACPCTILLSSPTALVSALSAAARLGVIIKNVAALESAGTVNAMAFDKTGTLTTGVLTVEKIYPATGLSEEYLLKHIAVAEFSSTHPAARALVGEALKRGWEIKPPESFEEKAGQGVKAQWNNCSVIVGKVKWLTANNVKIPPEYQSDTLDGENDSGDKSVLLAAINGDFAGLLTLNDHIRDDAGIMMRKLRENGINKQVMLSGDRYSAAERVAAELGCEVEAEILPEDKMNRVVAIRERGYKLAVVGDGVNDAPALAAGDVSIAMGAAGSDVAIHSASIVLMNNKLDRIPFIMHLSRRTLSIIRQNLFFSVLYIFILLLLSASGSIPPALAVIMHTASAFLVVFNSARLLREGEDLT